MRFGGSDHKRKFQRGSERIRADHPGVGLGLAIVKSITDAHDGTLTLTPRAAGGLCVTIHLPAAPHPGRRNAARRRPDSQDRLSSSS
ncbi:MAG TPA: ATP-binding protein [Solirubrobacteraceae bacterium]